jgi:3-phenylpropionate/trans-cinnamate dioxygenase ferredoxin reductase subunit
MGKFCKVTVNELSFLARRGDLLLDAALSNNVDLPHDCRSGICGACRVRLVKGRVFGNQEDGSGLVHACQSRVISDLQIVTDDMPEAVSVSGRVRRLTRLAPDIVGVSLDLAKPLKFLPGQYCKLQFRGFPIRSFSPTFPLNGGPDDRVLEFHIRVVRGGRVSAAIGDNIKVGHTVKVSGPFGTAFFRPDHTGGMVLVSSGTGFAPMWSIAVAAIFEQPKRELILIVGARTVKSLYMLRALCRLARFPNVSIVPVVSEPTDLSEAIRAGRPTDHMPRLSPSDIVYAAGAPAMTAHVAEIARAAGARCYADPFVASASVRERPRRSGLIGHLAAAARL